MKPPRDGGALVPQAAFPEPLYLDNHLLVVVKPAGMLSQEDRTGDLDLVTAAKAYLKARFDRPGNVFVGLVHRLDRPVSGVMVLARTSKAAARLSEQFRTRTVAKHYLALVEGTLAGSGRRTDWLIKADEAVRVVPPGTPGAREATLSWSARWTDGRRSLVRVRLETGRAHQIRVQLAARGHPIVGDRRHGATSDWRRGAIALHAAALEVEHPTQRVPLRLAAAPDGWRGVPADDLAAAISDLQAEEHRPSPPDGAA